MSLKKPNLDRKQTYTEHSACLRLCAWPWWVTTNAQTKLLPSSYKLLSPSCCRGCEIVAKFLTQLSPQQMPLLWKHPWLSGQIRGEHEPNHRWQWQGLKEHHVRWEGRESSGKEKWEAKGLLPFHHPPALKSFHMFCHPPTEATETSDQCWKGQCGFLPRNSLFKIIRSIITG